MTDTQHTPGPWATDGREAGWNILGLAGERVATVWRDGPGQPANARLIAAAPETLAALEELVGAVERFIYPQPDKPDSAWAKLVRARAAIAKATGQTI